MITLNEFLKQMLSISTAATTGSQDSLWRF